MASTLRPPTSVPGSDAEQPGAAARPRPTLVWGLVHGLVAVVAPLLVAGVLGLLGWYLSDAGSHGDARDGLRAGAVGWLVGHGSGFTVDGVEVTVVPLLVTGAVAWWVWRTATALGERVWAHGPDVHRLDDGERDWTVLVAVTGFATAYLGSALLLANLVAGPSFDPRAARVLGVSLLLVLLLAAPGVAVGSGRAAAWLSQVPPVVRHAFTTARRVVAWWLTTCLVLLVVSVGLGLGDAIEMVDTLDLSAGETVQLLLLNLAFVPNGVLMAGAFLLGPGFSVGAGTLVQPGTVVLGPLPLMPLLAGLPDPGTSPGWWGLAAMVPVVVAAAAAWRQQAERPTLRWDEGALRSCGAGLVAAGVLALLTAVAGGAAGPGRLREVGAPAGEVGLHAVVWLGLGALLGGLAITWWQRRTSVPVDELSGDVAGASAPSADL